MRGDKLKGHLDLLLLSVLADTGEAHGYKLISRLRDDSGGEFDLPEGTVYPALHRLEAGGLLRSRWVEDSGRRRRCYGITATGVTALRDMRQEWSRFVTGMHAVIGWSG